MQFYFNAVAPSHETVQVGTKSIVDLSKDPVSGPNWMAFLFFSHCSRFFWHFFWICFPDAFHLSELFHAPRIFLCFACFEILLPSDWSNCSTFFPFRNFLNFRQAHLSLPFFLNQSLTIGEFVPNNIFQYFVFILVFSSR